MKEDARMSAEPGMLKSQIASLEELLKALEQTTLEQARGLEFRNLLLETQSEASIDGILVVNESGVIILHNRRFVDLWGLAPETIMSKPHIEALQPVMHKLVDPVVFLARLKHLYEHREETGRYEFAFKDGRVIDRYSAPMVGPDGTYYGRVWYLRDITEHRRADEDMKKLSLAVEHSSDWVLITDKGGAIEYANRAVEEMSGYKKEEILGKTPRIFKSGKHSEQFYKELWTVLLSGDTFRAIISNRKKEGGLFELFHTITPLKDDKGAVTHFISTAKDLTQLKLLEEKVYRLAYYDDLTGLPNRAFHKELMKRAIENAKRYKQTFGVLFIDLDNFKRINDTLGHDIGDLLLKKVAQKLSDMLRSSDSVARSSEEEAPDVLTRLGGDEFLALLLNLREAQDAARVAHRMLKDLSKPFDLNGREVFITASIGISLYPDDGAGVEDLLKNADVAMYHAKDEGRNNCQFYSKSMNASVLELLTMENELRKALERDELVLYYQPKLNAATRTITGMEALVRWRHPDRGLIFPGRFIPLAETSGLIIQIGEFSLRTACAQMKLWQDAGFNPMSVAVNVSGRHFSQKNLIEVVNSALEDAGLSPERLELEITESTIMRDPEEAVRALLELKARGIQIAIDDFGTGYSSLSYLKRLPLDFLKVDQSFVKNLASSHSDRAIVRAIIAMAHTLNLKVIAEGVETEEQLSFLLEQGCDELQGFLFSQAVPSQEFSKLLEKEQL
jgi:diguanylate cyclase (GGDEF)-like protein/PAS domain S-box-containing protein